MTAYDRLDLLFQQNNGIVKTAQVLEIGIAKSTFYAYAKQRGVEQAAHGVYVSPDAWTDAMYLLHLRCAQAVFSHESALFFHDLTDREPNPYSITVKTGYNPASLQADGIKVYTIKKELHDVGYSFKLMLEDRSIEILAYNLETVLAEKLETVVSRATTNTRMRDFYDLHILSQLHGQSIVPADLRAALIATARKRGTEKYLADAPAAFDEVEADPNMEKLWRAYQKKFSYAADLSWHTVMESIRSLYELARE